MDLVLHNEINILEKGKKKMENNDFLRDLSDLIENERTESATLTEEYYEQPAQVGSAIDVYKQAISKYKF